MPSKSKRTLQSNVLPGRTFPCEEKCNTCLDVAALDNKIVTLQRAIAELEAERLKLLPKVNNRHDIITNKLPVEVSTRILELSLPVPDIPRGECSRLETLGPLVYSAVCRRWRDLVFSSPSLWAVVLIYRTGHFPQVMEELMEAWLSRSGQSLLSIVIDVDIHGIQFQFIPRILSHHSHRLEYLRVNGEFELLPVVRRMDSGKSSVRGDTIFGLTNSLYAHPDKGARLKIRQDSQLAAFDLEHLPSRAIIGVYVSRLTHVDLSWPRLVVVMDLLVSAPTMVDLSINGIYEDEFTEPLIIHQGLRSLRLSCYSDTLHRVLGYLALPSLKHLDLTILVATEPSSRVLLDGVVHFLHQSSAILEYLSIRALPLDPRDDAYTSLKTLIRILSPSIKHLVIDVKPRTDDWNQPEAPQQLIDSIFQGQESLPYLQSITFSAIDKIWLHQLKALLLAISRFMSDNGVRPISLVMKFGSNPLYSEDVEGGLATIHRAGTLSLPGPEIAEMLSLKEQFGVTIKILVQDDFEKEVSDSVLDILTRMVQEE